MKSFNSSPQTNRNNKKNNKRKIFCLIFVASGTFLHSPFSGQETVFGFVIRKEERFMVCSVVKGFTYSPLSFTLGAGSSVKGQ